MPRPEDTLAHTPRARHAIATRIAALAMLDTGLSIVEVGRKLGVDRSTVRGWALRHTTAVPSPQLQLVPEVRGAQRRPGRPHAPEVRAEARRLLAVGRPARLVSADLGVPLSTVQMWASPPKLPTSPGAAPVPSPIVSQVPALEWLRPLLLEVRTILDRLLST